MIIAVFIELQYSSVRFSPALIWSAMENPYELEFNHLRPNRMYGVTITAMNEKGFGPTSPRITFTTKPRVNVGQPRNVN